MLSTVELETMVGRLAHLDSDIDDTQRITQLGLLERLKGAAAAAQARVSVDFEASQRREQAAAGLPADQQGRGVADQIALARHDSKVKGSRHLGLAKALVKEMPHTMAALTSGAISEWRATIVVRETAVLSAADRRQVDARLVAEMPHLGDAQLARRARAIGYQLDAESVLRRVRGAIRDRRVRIRPAPDTMALVTGFLPVAQGVAVHAALTAAAASAKALGDERSKGQIMAHTFVQRLTGQTTADAVPFEVQLVMTDRTLEGDDTPAQIPGFGPVPAAFARDLVTGRAGGHSADPDQARLAEVARVWVRRLFTSPADGTLVAMDSRRRSFDGLLRRFLVARDQVCRTRWCDAPICHTDHVRASAEGGETMADNGQGLCARCNYAKELPGWRCEVVTGQGRHRVRTTTPTGHSYESTAPPVLVLGGLAPPGRYSSGDHDLLDTQGMPGMPGSPGLPGIPGGADEGALVTAFEALIRAA
ncbi:DUF222 domain-containing protein [Lapillicoccus sp.]|uniref:HNH endonuclease n=1 Tax=Lapillicoccus sp. TaxID=1909287 RepID=UPI0039832A63